MSEEPLRQLLADLRAADTDRQCTPRDSPQYGEAAERVDRLVRAVWDATEPQSVHAAMEDSARDDGASCAQL